ncbi:MAG TPA: response regulator transcription factor [Ensifer sp.]|nr:response regulator transcription factor [Ensifer sp.]
MTSDILIIDDDTRLTAMLEDYLRKQGFATRASATGKDGLAEIARTPPAVVILDLMLPDLDGFEVCRKVRATSDLPILMLTAKGEETDRIVGLELGADDYLPKPFSPRELLARLRAILRRSQGTMTSARDADILTFGDLEIDRGARQIRVAGEERQITGYQYDLLLALAENAGRVLSRDQLMDMVKGEELEAFDRSIDVHISRIRAAIETDPKHPRRIITVRGAGYLFVRNQTPAGGA